MLFNNILIIHNLKYSINSDQKHCGSTVENCSYMFIPCDQKTTTNYFLIFTSVMLFYNMNNEQPQTTVPHKHECIISFIIYYVVKQH